MLVLQSITSDRADLVHVAYSLTEMKLYLEENSGSLTKLPALVVLEINLQERFVRTYGFVTCGARHAYITKSAGPKLPISVLPC